MFCLYSYFYFICNTSLTCILNSLSERQHSCHIFFVLMKLSEILLPILIHIYFPFILVLSSTESYAFSKSTKTICTSHPLHLIFFMDWCNEHMLSTHDLSAVNPLCSSPLDSDNWVNTNILRTFGRDRFQRRINIKTIKTILVLTRYIWCNNAEGVAISQDALCCWNNVTDSVLWFSIFIDDCEWTIYTHMCVFHLS